MSLLLSRAADFFLGKSGRRYFSGLLWRKRSNGSFSIINSDPPWAQDSPWEFPSFAFLSPMKSLYMALIAGMIAKLLLLKAFASCERD